MAKIGYARVSSVDQNLARQFEQLSDCEKIFSEKSSGKDTNREGLQQLLAYIRDGDVVVVTELKRLGRNSNELTEMLNTIQHKGATVEVLNLPTLTGIEDENLRRLLNNLIMELFKYQAEEERKYILETQRQGIEIAKRQGKYKGGKRKFKQDDPRLLHAFELYLSGKTEKDVERLTGINRRTFQRYRNRYNIYREVK